MTQATTTDRPTNSLGATDAAAALGLDRYRSQYQLYLEKTEPEQYRREMTLPMELGIFLEPFVASKYEDAIEGVTLHAADVVRHETIPYLHASPDRWAHLDGEIYLLECKSANDRMADQFGPSGSDHMPIAYFLQCHHQMICTGVAYVDLAVLIGNAELRILRVHRDAKIEDHLIDREGEFWARVEERRPPDPMTLADCTSRWRAVVGQSKVIEPRMVRVVQDLSDLRSSRRALEGQIKSRELEVAKFMDSATELIDGHGRTLLTYCQIDRRGYTVQPTSYRAIRIGKGASGG